MKVHINISEKSANVMFPLRAMIKQAISFLQNSIQVNICLKEGQQFSKITLIEDKNDMHVARFEVGSKDY